MRSAVNVSIPSLWGHGDIAAQMNVRYGHDGERACPARLRGRRCHHDAGAWSYAGLCPLHVRMLSGGCRVVLIDGTVLTHLWTKGRAYTGPFARPSRQPEGAAA